MMNEVWVVMREVYRWSYGGSGNDIQYIDSIHATKDKADLYIKEMSKKSNPSKIYYFIDDESPWSVG